MVRTKLHRKDGFTLIEVLIVIVMISILASLSMLRWHHRKVEAIVASMKNDLRNLAVAEEAYYSDYNTYTSDVNQLIFRASANVSITIQSDSDGWTADATHPNADGEVCALYHGDIAPLSPARGEGIVWCE